MDESFESAVEPHVPLFCACAVDLVVIGASWGGVVALKKILAALPADFPAPIAVVQHISPASRGLAHVLGYESRLDVRLAVDGERLRAGIVYIAPPGAHLMVSPLRRFAVVDSAKVNYARPAVDPLFESASAALGPRLLGLILTGMGRDGAAGAATIKRRGGTVVVQDQDSSEACEMPRAAIRSGSPDLVLPLSSIANALISLIAVPGGMAFFGLPRPASAEPAVVQ